MMKTNSLTTAVVAGLAGLAGFANLSNAVELNPDGLGQVLLYPYYTVNENQQTYLSVVNTADVAKVVKVRFLEGKNSREVFDFNLWLSPHDVWIAGLAALSDIGGTGDGVAILTDDTSCSPFTYYTPEGTYNGRPYFTFSNTAYTESDDGGGTGLDRTREGHFEIISMADLDPNGDYAAAVTHANGVPDDCSVIDGLGDPGNPVDSSELDPPTGGLFGAGGVMNPAQGTFYTFNADAIDGFTATTLFAASGTSSPSLADANTTLSTAVSYVFGDGGRLFTSSFAIDADRGGIDAVSAVLMADSIYNEYVVGADEGANTDWVVTFPTKKYYTDPDIVGSTAVAPFAEIFGETTDGQSCATIDVTKYDREEGTTVTSTSPISPRGSNSTGNALCLETNVISFLAATNANAGVKSAVLGSKLVANIPPLADAGWMVLNLYSNSTTTETHQLSQSIDGDRFRGLPTTGFSATNYVNGSVNGVLANYSGVYRHRSHRTCLNSGTNDGICS